MAGSFRRRLLMIASLAVLACGAALAAILVLSRTATEERTAHARENVGREVERLQCAMAAVPLDQRSGRRYLSGELRSGAIADASSPEPTLPPVVGRVATEAASSASTIVREGEDDGTWMLVAAAPLQGSGVVFAYQPVVAGRETRGLRVVAVLVALLSLGLVIASLRTLRAVERDVSTLRGSLTMLAKDLRTPLAHPGLRELDEVAGGIAAVAQDLDGAQREHERLTRELAAGERLAALGRVTAGVAHEVRNPLTSMKLRADLARSGSDVPPSVAKDLDDIASEIARLDRLVSDLLVVAGRRTGPRTHVELAELVGRRVALLAPWAKEKGVAVESRGAAEAEVDADGLSRAIDNLLRNAIEASSAGTTVAVEIGAKSGEASVRVIDRGPGVPSDRTAELFEPFFTTKPGGTGLGLCLARSVAIAHDGSLTYAREEDRTIMTLAVKSGSRADAAGG
jgi:signal transduction histidine kinase